MRRSGPRTHTGSSLPCLSVPPLPANVHTARLAPVRRLEVDVSESLRTAAAMDRGAKRQKVSSWELSKGERQFLTALPDLQTTFSYLEGASPKQQWIDQVSHLVFLSSLSQISGILDTILTKWMKNTQLLLDLEKIMIYLSDLTQDCHPTRMQILSSTPCFLRSILSLLSSWKFLENKSSSSALQFHRSYHLGMFVLLGLINGRTLCEEFLRVIQMVSTTASICVHCRLLTNPICSR
jgi:hypothetical protein